MSSLILQQYGITLKRVEEEDIELIRKWRNHPSIKKRMAYKKKISELEQKKWFASINNKYNYYFMIMIDNQSIGVINCKDTSVEEKYGEGGIFIWEEKFIQTPTPFIASMILLDYIFNCIEIGNISFIRILSDNQPAIRYNRYLGYIKAPKQENIKNQLYVLTKETFNNKISRLRKAAGNFNESDRVLHVSGNICELNLPEVNESINKDYTM
ncbi:MAG: GNAT family N-acetyltransferase [Flavobacteriales bacterium]|nr:GNAT family N-acetyltransferase [Flavobacteriales bacterium]